MTRAQLLSVTFLAIAFCFSRPGDICRAAEVPPPIVFQSKAVDIPKIGLFVGKEVESPALAQAGIHIRVLDRKAILSEGPIVLRQGDALYLWIGDGNGFLRDFDVLDADGSSVVLSATGPLVAPGGMFRAPTGKDGDVLSLKLSRPVDENMTLHMKLYSDMVFQTTYITGIDHLIGKKVSDPLLTDTGMEMEVLDSRTAPIEGQFGVFDIKIRNHWPKVVSVLRITGQPEVLAMLEAPQELMSPDGRPWGLENNKIRESDTSVIFTYAGQPPAAKDLMVKLVLPLPRDMKVRTTAWKPTPRGGSTKSSGPTTHPMQEQMSAWLLALGDDNVQARDKAEAALFGAGADAIPAIQAAANEGSPEVQHRAARLIRALGRPKLPQAWQKGDPFSSQADMTWWDDGTHYRRQISGQIRIWEFQDNEGLRMMMGGYVDGVYTVQQFYASTEEVLHHDYPQAWALHDKFFGEKPQQPMQPIMVLMQDEVDKEMKKRNIPADKRKKVLDQIQHMGDVHGHHMDASIAIAEGIRKTNADKEELAWWHEADKLRAMLAEINVPPPADFDNPRPPRQRLGIAFGALENLADSGLRIGHVVAGDRGSIMGLQDDDVIQKINGAPIQDREDYDREMAKEPALVVIDGVRSGKPFHLEGK